MAPPVLTYVGSPTQQPVLPPAPNVALHTSLRSLFYPVLETVSEPSAQPAGPHTPVDSSWPCLSFWAADCGQSFHTLDLGPRNLGRRTQGSPCLHSLLSEKGKEHGRTVRGLLLKRHRGQGKSEKAEFQGSPLHKKPHCPVPRNLQEPMA